MFKLLESIYNKFKAFILTIFRGAETKAAQEVREKHNNKRPAVSKAFGRLGAGNSINQRAKALERQFSSPISMMVRNCAKEGKGVLFFGTDKKAPYKYKTALREMHKNILNRHMKNKKRGKRRWPESRPVHIKELKI